MKWLGMLFGIVVLGGLSALVWVLLRFNLKRRRIARAAATTTDEQLERICGLIEECGSETPLGGILVRTNNSFGDNECVVRLPANIPDFPWAGRAVVIETQPSVGFRFIEASEGPTRFLGRVYRHVRVPRRRLASGKFRNIFSPARYIAANPRLKDALSAVCPEHPESLLAYLLCPGQSGFEFEPIDQARIATSPAWVQDPDTPVCGRCRKRMLPILQLPGSLLRAKGLGRSTFYLFGCKTHPENTETVEQLT